MPYRYSIIDSTGRLWARTLTRIKAVRVAEMLYKQKGLICMVLEIKQIA